MKSTTYSMKRSVVIGAMALAQSIGMISPLAVLAADNQVRIAGMDIFSVPAAAGLTADKRAEIVQQNLDNALVAAKDRTPSSVTITYVKGVPVVTLGGYQVITVDSASAKSLGTTPAALATKWANGIRDSLRDQTSIQAYVSQLSGDYSSSAPAAYNSPAPQQQPSFNAQAQQNYSAPPSYGQPNFGGAPGGYRQGRVTYAPAGLVIPIALSAGISTQVAKAGDVIQATVSQTVMLGDSTIPQGSVVMGTITDADAGKMLGRSGSLGIKFNRLRTPDGVETPISAHLIDGLGKYAAGASEDTFKGETWKGKAVQAGVRGAIGAGTGAALGTAVGAIAGGRGGVGKGAWSGTAIGAGVGVAQSLILRKGKDVNVQAGTAMQLQLDAPVSIAGAAPVNPY